MDIRETLIALRDMIVIALFASAFLVVMFALHLEVLTW